MSPSGNPAARGTRARPTTLERALAVAPARAVIRLAPGTYPGIELTRRAHPSLIVRGPRGAKSPRRVRPAARIAGATIEGALGLRFERVAFTKPVEVGPRTVDSRVLRSARLTFNRVEFTSPGDNCLRIRGGTRRLEVSQSFIHHCMRGVDGPASATEPVSRALTFRDNVLEEFTDDAVLFGSWANVLFEDNLMQDASDPAGVAHNDLLQLVGPARNIQVIRNVLRRSDDQIVLVQPAVGEISGVRFVNNLLYGCGGYAVQSSVPGLEFVHNTVWESRFGALLLRADRGLAPQDSVVANNILDAMQTYEGARPRVFEGNVLGRIQGLDRGNNRLLSGSPFADLAGGDFRPQPRVRSASRVDREYSPTRDLRGRKRGARPAPGALEPAGKSR